MKMKKFTLNENLSAGFKLLAFQTIFIVLSPLIQNIFQYFVLYNDPYHLAFIFIVLFPYLSGILSVFILGRDGEIFLENENKTEKRTLFDSKDLLLMLSSFVIALMLWSRWLFYELPVGFDTPRYLADAKRSLEQWHSIDINNLLFTRQLYHLILGLGLKLFNEDALLLGKSLWLQVLLILFANYLLIKSVTGSRIAALFSNYMWVLWIRTSRVITDLHANTFGIFIILLTQFTLTLWLKRPTIKLLILFFFSSSLILPIHNLSFAVFALSLSSYFVILSLSKTSIETYCKIPQLKALEYSRKFFILIPLVTYMMALIVMSKLNLADLLRWWWPETPIYDLDKFINSLGGLVPTLFTQFTILCIVLFERRNPIFRYFFSYLFITLLCFQNNIFGLHALPERFAVFTFLPFYSGIGLFFLSRFFQKVIKLNLNIKFLIRRKYIRAHFSSKVIHLLLLLFIMLVSLYPMSIDQVNYVSKTKPLINIDEYQCLKLVYENHISLEEYENKTVVIVVPRPVLTEWFREIYPYAIKLKSPNVDLLNGIYVISYNLLENNSFPRKWDIVYLVNIGNEINTKISMEKYHLIEVSDKNCKIIKVILNNSLT
ncbi:MAG: hypothetical protein NZ929_05775 [Aigarchaeota archaeon]|nr:hypothetical protein [Aigarchaeota archaeon]MDW7986877.1 hypothetical protein [Nitrososphaerota archaeon]